MEDVWKNITLTSHHSHPTSAIKAPSTSATHRPTLRTPTLHDYLSRSLDKEHQPLPPHAPDFPVSRAACFPGSPPTIAMSLEYTGLPDEATGPGRRKSVPLCGINADGGGGVRAMPGSFISSLNFPTLDALASSSEFPAFCKKRVLENDDGPGDRRHQRMMKNRESAARSRARRQAYTYELEQAVTQLMEENARLKRQLRVAAASEPLKKKTLYRTSTAPF